MCQITAGHPSSSSSARYIRRPRSCGRDLAEELLASPGGFPWVERNKATFVFDSPAAQSVALNIDIVNRDPPFETHVRLEDTSVWYFQRFF